MIYLELLLGFLKVGLFSFGGAYGAIPLIRDVVLSYGWLSDETFTNMIAVSESTPGPIMVNLATYVGSAKAGMLGAIVATMAVVLPSFIIILLIMLVLRKYQKHPYVQAILKGMKPCIMEIILATGIYMLYNASILTYMNNNDAVGILVGGILLFIYYGSRKYLSKGITPIQLLVMGAILGIVCKSIG